MVNSEWFAAAGFPAACVPVRGRWFLHRGAEVVSAAVRDEGALRMRRAPCGYCGYCGYCGCKLFLSFVRNAGC